MAVWIRVCRSFQLIASRLTLMPVWVVKSWRTGVRTSLSLSRLVPWLLAQYVSVTSEFPEALLPACCSLPPPPQLAAVSASATPAATTDTRRNILTERSLRLFLVSAGDGSGRAARVGRTASLSPPGHLDPEWCHMLKGLSIRGDDMTRVSGCRARGGASTVASAAHQPRAAPMSSSSTAGRGSGRIG